MAIRPGSGRRLRRHRAVLAAALAVATAGVLGPTSPAMVRSSTGTEIAVVSEP